MRISERGQITIPKKLRDRFGMHQGVEVEISVADGGLLIRKLIEVDHPVDRVFGILKKGQHPGIPIEGVDAYIEEIKGR